MMNENSALLLLLALTGIFNQEKERGDNEQSIDVDESI